MSESVRFVVVEVFDDSDVDVVAKEIVHNLEDVKVAYTAYSDGTGRMIRVGEDIES